MFEGNEIARELEDWGVSHVIWLPDSALGPWEEALDASAQLRLVRVCREGEAWSTAAGLYLGGAQPLVMIQCTGLFDSGDAMRNALFDMHLPLFAVIGYRSYLVENSPDTARRFTEPILDAWGIEYVVLRDSADLPLARDHYHRCRETDQPGAVLVAEGRM